MESTQNKQFYDVTKKTKNFSRAQKWPASRKFVFLKRKINQFDRKKIPSPEPRNSRLAAKAENLISDRKINHFTKKKKPSPPEIAG